MIVKKILPSGKVLIEQTAYYIYRSEKDLEAGKNYLVMTSDKTCIESFLTEKQREI